MSENRPTVVPFENMSVRDRELAMKSGNTRVVFLDGTQRSDWNRVEAPNLTLEQVGIFDSEGNFITNTAEVILASGVVIIPYRRTPEGSLQFYMQEQKYPLSNTTKQSKEARLTFPQGRQELDEKPLEAAIAELMEEAGLKPKGQMFFLGITERNNPQSVIPGSTVMLGGGR